MEDYSFWADLLASYRASPDIIKALWLMVPLVLRRASSRWAWGWRCG
ncbi:MAG: hypothetical protein M9945_03120 [Aquamicrobium sp.]|nr:hypothetical protein [Aquamicrobium sp.]